MASQEGETRGGARPVHFAPILPLFVVALLASRLITDNSFLWHIRAGAAQFDLGKVLDVDVFSFTVNGESWRTQSWLVELLYAAMESTFGGLAWANWMILATASLVVLFLALSIYQVTRSPISTGLALMLVVWLMGPFIQPRPVIFSYALAAALVVTLQHRERLLWAIVPIMWIWASVHGSWVIGGVLIILELLRTRDRKLFFAGVAAAVATLATPHFYGTWAIAADFFSASENLSLMEEWQVPDFVDIVQAPYLLIIFGIVIAGIRGRLAMRDLIVIVPFLILGMSSRRAVFPSAIVLIPWACMAIPMIAPSATKLKRSVFVAGTAVLALVVLLPMFVRPLGVLDESRFPTDELVDAMGSDRAFHGDGEGGYLIYAEWPERLVYVDDRAELYPHEFFGGEYPDATNGDYEEAFDRWGIDVALSRADWPLTAVLLEDGWVVRAENEYFTVFGRP